MAEKSQARPDRPAPTPLVHFQIDEQVERLKQEPAWRSGSRNAITLTKEPTLRLVLMLLGKGTTLHEHQAAGPLTLHVLSGLVSFRTADGTEQVQPGEVVVLEAAVEHEVEALEESACLLSLVGTS